MVDHDKILAEAAKEAARTAVNRTFEEASHFLRLICEPAAQELGLMLGDVVSIWRRINTAKLLMLAKKKFDSINPASFKVHPRLVHEIIDGGSWTDNITLQNMWAGLLVSAGMATSSDESNLIFINILKQLTGSEARILNHICEKSNKKVTESGFIVAEDYRLSIGEVRTITGIEDIDELDRQLDHLNSLRLFAPEGGFRIDDATHTALVTPSPLALNLYIRANGSNQNIDEYFEKEEKS